MSGTTSTNTTSFAFDGQIDPFTVPADGTYRITAIGGGGGGDNGGLGATESGDFTLTKNEALSILAGGQGGAGGYSRVGAVGNGPGGGGGSFVVATQSGGALVIGGGGGGGSTVSNYPGGNGGGFVSSAAGVGNGANNGDSFPYGDNGSGGGGGGGGGLLNDGTAGESLAGSGGAGGLSFVHGGTGGPGGNDPNADPTVNNEPNNSGGFGGGGGGGGGEGSTPGGGGGGGGYTGGNGGYGHEYSYNVESSSTGGTSFDGGTNQYHGLAASLSNGSVTITELFAPVVQSENGFSTNYGSTLILNQAQLLAGDTDPQQGVTPGDILKITKIDSVSAGTAILNADGSVTFTAPATAGANNSANFTYTVTDTDGLSSIATATVALTTPVVPPTIKTNPLPITVAEGQTTTNLYQTLVQDVQDANPNAQVSITSLGLSNTMGFAYLDQGHGLLTYTADGDQPNAKQPQDSFTYTATDRFGQQITGTVAVTVTGASEPTQVGTAGNDTLTASSASQRLDGLAGNDTLNVNAAKALVFGGQGDDTINVNAAKATVYGGPGTNTINLGNTAQDTIVLQQGGTDNISGFNLHSNVLDLSQALAEAHVSATLGTIGNDVTVTASGSNATLSLTPAAQVPGFGAMLATLQNVGTGVTLQTLINDGALKVA